MEVYKRAGSKSWYVDLVHPATQRRVRQSLKFEGTKTLAQRKADALQRALEQEATQYQDGHRPTTIGKALEAYVSMLESKRQPSAKNQRYLMTRLLGPGGGLEAAKLTGASALHDITPAAMEGLALARLKGGSKAQTIKHDLGLLRAATRYAAGLGFRTPSIMTKGEVQNPWRVPEVAQKTRYLSPEEFAKVYDYLHPERAVWQPMVGRNVALPPHLRSARQESHDLLVALAYTGARWSEMAHLTWDRVNFNTRTIRLWAGKVEKERLVPMADPLRMVLQRRQATATGTLVFPGPGGRVRTKPSDAIGEAMDKVGLNEPDTVAKYGRATIHSLRHTFASWLVQNGADLGEVRDALGHSSITTTTRYAHLAKGATMTKLGGILSKIGGKDDTSGTTEGGDERHQYPGGHRQDGR